MSDTKPDPRVDLAERVARVRTEMGGAAKVQKMQEEGDRTIREHIDGLLDQDTFRELGTFSRSLKESDRDRTPGDGKIGGHGEVNGRPVAVFGDDITVLRGSSSIVGTRKEYRLYERALAMGIPIVHFGETGGGRIPDIMGAEGISEPGELFSMGRRRHRVPMATAIVGQSFGGSSFLSGMSDFVVMTRGSCLAVTSPKVFEVATGEQISFEELGGVDVHAKTTGQVPLWRWNFSESRVFTKPTPQQQFSSRCPRNARHSNTWILKCTSACLFIAFGSTGVDRKHI